jgi:hypothetical protein
MSCDRYFFTPLFFNNKNFLQLLMHFFNSLCLLVQSTSINVDYTYITWSAVAQSAFVVLNIFYCNVLVFITLSYLVVTHPSVSPDKAFASAISLSDALLSV